MTETRIVSLQATYQQVPLVDPFVLSIRQATYANIVRWRLLLSNGAEYLGESVPVEYVTGETPESVLRCANKVQEFVIGRSISDFREISRELEKHFPTQYASRAGVEIALLNAYTSTEGTTPFDYFGGAKHSVETDITITRVSNAIEIAERYAAEGFRTFKLKVGGEDVALDIARLQELHRRIPDCRIRLDANQGFTPEEAVRFITDVADLRIPVELIEQPVAKEDFAGLNFVAERSAIPVIADEACKTPEDAERLFAETAIHGVNVKVMKSGLFGALEITRIAQASKKQLMIGCMLETSIGIAASLALACGTGAFHYVDLDGHLLVRREVSITEFQTSGPILKVA